MNQYKKTLCKSLYFIYLHCILLMCN